MCAVITNCSKKEDVNPQNEESTKSNVSTTGYSYDITSVESIIKAADEELWKLIYNNQNLRVTSTLAKGLLIIKPEEGLIFCAKFNQICFIVLRGIPAEPVGDFIILPHLNKPEISPIEILEEKNTTFQTNPGINIAFAKNDTFELKKTEQVGTEFNLFEMKFVKQ